MSTIYFITHPDVQVEPHIPVPEWSLSDIGAKRMRTMLRLAWVGSVKSIYCSEEQKAVDGAEIMAGFLQLPVKMVQTLGENDRSSTGYLPAQAFELTADQFFANPLQSVRGWETALNAQSRIVSATKLIVESESGNGPIAIVSHGAVGALLLCHLNDWPIAREHDQPGQGGGNYFSFESSTYEVNHGWLPIDKQHLPERHPQ